MSVLQLTANEVRASLYPVKGLRVTFLYGINTATRTGDDAMIEAVKHLATAQPEGMVAGDWVMVPRGQIETLALLLGLETRASLKHWGDTLAAMLAAAPAPLRADAGVVERLREVLERLIAAGTQVSHKGATTGPQWIKLNAALASARSALTTPKPEAPQGEEAAPRQGENPYPDIMDYKALSPASSAPEGEIERARGQAEGFAAAVAWLRERSAMKPPATLHHAASILADQLEQSRIPASAALKGDADHG